MLNYRIDYSLEAPVVTTVNCNACEDGYVHHDDSTQLACSICDTDGTVNQTTWTQLHTVTHNFASMPSFDEIKTVTDAIECYAIVFQGFEE